MKILSGQAASPSPKGGLPEAHSVSYTSDGAGDPSDSEDEGTDGYKKGESSLRHHVSLNVPVCFLTPAFIQALTQAFILVQEDIIL